MSALRSYWGGASTGFSLEIKVEQLRPQGPESFNGDYNTINIKFLRPRSNIFPPPTLCHYFWLLFFRLNIRVSSRFSPTHSPRPPMWTTLDSCTMPSDDADNGGFVQGAHTNPTTIASSKPSVMNPFLLRTNSSHRPQNQGPTPLRLVGRGGIGSRPRPVVAAVDNPPPTPIHPDPANELNPTRRADSTRIVGRGGTGSRPRQLSSPVVAPERSDPPKSLPPIPPQPRPDQPVLYRPGGRGGAGSRPRKIKPASEANEKVKSAKFPWKGKGKEMDLGNSPAYLEPQGLTRTDTTLTEASSIQFALPRPVPSAQRVNHLLDASDYLPTYPPIPSTSGADWKQPAQQRATRFNKLARTLGVEFGSRQAAMMPQPSEITRATKAFRRSSVSTLSSVSESADTQRFLRRRSSYDSVRQLPYNGSMDSPVQEMPSIESAHAHRNAAHAQLTGRSGTSGVPSHLPPPSDSDALPEEWNQEDDGQSEMTENEDTSIMNDDESELRTISSTSTTPLYIHPPPSEYDTDADSRWDRSPTPTTMSLASLSSRTETPSSPHEKHFSIPFQRAPVVVSDSWEEADPVCAVIRNERAQGWYGEWNREDIQDVIDSLRELRL
ncbi:hypothetical protein DFH07DRAFT_940180 [Mycena maculata]|uniref:Uncharacterized protein n=1 Tax=Mycena maculata TaxID=230809 RepID=A0AAD7NFR8_9AGAR|nr:hypothetical protein DFH07DRAFT_940180 [Mycena maculata]